MQHLTKVHLDKDLLKSFPNLFGKQPINGKNISVLDFIGKLVHKFSSDFDSIAAARSKRNERGSIHSPEIFWLKPADLIEDADGNKKTVGEIRQGMIDNFLGVKSPLAWKLNPTCPVPPVALKPGLQGTGPADDLGMLFSAINTGTASWMFDWEDAGNDYKDKLYRAWQNLSDVLRGEWDNEKIYQHPTKKKNYTLKLKRGNWGSLFHRVPGLHLKNRQMTLNGISIPAVIPALVIHTLNNYESVKSNQGILFYTPKIETPEEALLLGRLLKTIEEEIEVKRGSLKIEMLHERALYTAHQEAIMWILRENLIGPNVGRWDYINSLIEIHKDDSVYMDPHRFNMAAPQLTAYTRRNALLTALVNGFPIGGMSAVMKNPAKSENDPKAIRSIWFDKLRERLTGLMIIADKELDLYRQSWVATTEEAYVRAGEEPLKASRSELQNLVDKTNENEKVLLQRLQLIDSKGKVSPFILKKENLTLNVLWSENAWEQITSVATGDITEEGLEYAIFMASEYMFQQLNGNNAAAIEDYLTGNRLMNDFATYEIFWHWLWTALHRHAVLTQDGKTTKKGEKVTNHLIQSLLNKRNLQVKKYFLDHPENPQGFNRDLAWVVMDILEKQLFHPIWIPYGSRVLLSIIEKSPEERDQILKGLFSSSRAEVEALVQNRTIIKSALDAYDYVFDKSPAAETDEALLKQKTDEVQNEWAKQRAEGRTIQRLHKARQVAELRLPKEFRPAYRVQNAMAQKMYRILRQHQQAGTSVRTVGFADEFSIEAAARCGLELSYNGGWLESARAGTSDQARYPYTYLAETISRYSRHLQQHARHNPSLADKFLMPMFVDIDTGHLAPKELVEFIMTYGIDAPLIGALHIEDQAHGAKKCGHMSGKVLISTDEHIKRLNNVRLQLDVMGLDTLVVARTDSEAAEFITSIHDKRDHPFILGVTNPNCGPYHVMIGQAREKGLPENEIAQIHKEWKQSAHLSTLGEIIAETIDKNPQEKFPLSKNEWLEFASDASFTQAIEKAKTMGIRVWSGPEWKLLKEQNSFPKNVINILWDCHLASTEESGYTLFMIRSGLNMAIARSKAFLPFADISWMEQHHPSIKESAAWALALKDHAKKIGLSEPLLANNTSPSFYWRAEEKGHKLTDQELTNFLDEQGRHIQFQFITYGGSELDHRNIQKFLEGPDGFLEKGMLAWANFQDEAIQKGNAFVLDSQGFAGVKWNEKRDVAGNGATLIASATGDGNTMKQFEQAPKKTEK